MNNLASSATSGAVVAASVTLFLYLFLQIAKRPARRDAATGDLVLQFSMVFTVIMGAIGVGAPIGLAILSLVVGFKTPNERYIPVIMGAAFFLLGVGIVPYLLKTRVRVNSERLRAEGVFAAPRDLRWADIERVKFKSDGSLRLISGGKQRMEISPLMVGIGEFAGLLDQHLPPAAQAASQKDLEKFRALLRR